MKHSRNCNLTPIIAAFFILDGLLLLFLVVYIIVQMHGSTYYPQLFIKLFSFVNANIIPIGSFVATLITLLFAYRIPFRIMQNQLYVDLMREYRTETMLQNIDRILAACGGEVDYSRCDYCKCSVENNIRDGKDLGVCKHQRQSVSQWYWQLAGLLFSKKYYGCSRKIQSLIKKDFTRHDSYIICIVYHLNRANDIWKLNKPISKFTKRLGKLFELSKEWR